ncbi:MAG TPA: LLM class flavin-dependent oxidoreductase [Ilumatobacteraceae bacterium]|nr:LLM class flavin-dependent oxidoreductase [Ilumatobacteraceae bacterium]
MQFSVWPSYDRSWNETLALAQWAEASGFQSFWYADHLMSQVEDGDSGDAHECWTVLAAIGALVPRVRLVSMVSPVTIHHPVVLAKRATTVDHISGGRAVLGLGAGWMVEEHAAYGFELPEPGPRVTRFAEAIEIVNRLFREDSVNFHGSRYELTDAPFGPKPVNGTLPLLVGTGSPRMLRLTARWAQEWNTWGDPAEVGRRTERFRTACDAVGRDPGSLHRSAQAMIFYAPTAAARAAMEPHVVADRSLIGGTQELIDQLAQYVELGVDEFAIPDFTLGDTPEARRETYEALHADVLSALP